MSIALRLADLKKDLPPQVTLVAVSKFHPASAIKEAYEVGQRIFGESRMQELVAKHIELPKDIEWHFIGHLQTNKVKSIIPCVHTIHSVDSWKLLAEIEKQASIADKQVNCLLEIHIAKEDSKVGFSFDDCREILTESEWKSFKHLKIIGLMGMATFTSDRKQICDEFKTLNCFFQEMKSSFFTNEPSFCQLSMGMSNDYREAIAEGSTIVRIGSSIFGERN